MCITSREQLYFYVAGAIVDYAFGKTKYGSGIGMAANICKFGFSLVRARFAKEKSQ